MWQKDWKLSIVVVVPLCMRTWSPIYMAKWSLFLPLTLSMCVFWCAYTHVCVCVFPLETNASLVPVCDQRTACFSFHIHIFRSLFWSTSHTLHPNDDMWRHLNFSWYFSICIRLFRIHTSCSFSCSAIWYLHKFKLCLFNAIYLSKSVCECVAFCTGGKILRFQTMDVFSTFPNYGRIFYVLKVQIRGKTNAFFIILDFHKCW